MNFCECGHEPADHYREDGACEYFDDQFPCSCPRYEWQGDN
jgi:hypothetical protein